ncbi:hypothetical protein [Flavobacterium limnophilum]|uniref:hypothetical protein n=1 Tax=Flavobacterium limnophilum TaxID=3003262 RepID=UPI002482A453|nr:hypothetical protein [Flavobacterium limnophilum]
MKKTFLNKLLLGFSAILLFVYGIIYACAGGDDWGWSFDSNFTPEAFVDKSYTPLFLSQYFFYTGFDTEHNSRFNDEIVQDWADFLKGKMDVKTVRFFLIDSSATDIKKIQDFYITQKNNSVSNKWSKKIDLNDRRISGFFTFLSLSKQVETASISDGNNWSYEPVVQKTFNNIKTIKTIENRYNTVSDLFLKNRYWFQTIKAYFYNGDQQTAIAFFQKTENTVPKNTLYYRALAYIAGMNYKKKNYALSNYQYSQVFDKCPAMRVVSAYCFHPKEEKDWKESLNLAKTNEGKAALWAIQGYYGDEEKAIAEIYNLQPKSEHLDYLLTRLINNQETKIDNSFKEKSVVENKKRTKDSIHKSTIDLVVKIAQSDKTAKPYLWNVAAGYLETLNGNYAQADKNFDKAESKMPQTPLAISQVRLLRFVNNLSKIEKIGSNNEKTILKDLTWLYNETPKNNIENFRYYNATAWSKKYLSALYKSQKNEVMAELFDRDNNFYDNEENLKAMKVFLSKNNKTEIEKIGVGVYDVTLDDINNYQAVVATFANKIPEAIEFMQKTNKLQETKFYGNPFNGSIKDCHDCDHVAYQKKKYSQIDFLNTIKTMQENVAKGEDVHANLLLLGNAFYNITHYGNARIFHETNITGYGYSSYDFRDKIRDMIADCSLAKMYYQKALAVAKTNEQKAKCYYMIAKCERNEYYNNQYDPNKDSWENQYALRSSKINFIAWDGFKILKRDYSNTKYYQEVINECGYFRTFVSQN